MITSFFNTEDKTFQQPTRTWLQLYDPIAIKLRVCNTKLGMQTGFPTVLGCLLSQVCQGSHRNWKTICEGQFIGPINPSTAKFQTPMFPDLQENIFLLF